MTPARTEIAKLPVDDLRALVRSMLVERDVLTAERDTLLERNERLHHLLLKLNRLQFGRKSETVSPSTDRIEVGPSN